jgi:hypothetical protein
MRWVNGAVAVAVSWVWGVAFPSPAPTPVTPATTTTPEANPPGTPPTPRYDASPRRACPAIRRRWNPGLAGCRSRWSHRAGPVQRGAAMASAQTASTAAGSRIGPSSGAEARFRAKPSEWSVSGAPRARPVGAPLGWGGGARSGRLPGLRPPPRRGSRVAGRGRRARPVPRWWRARGAGSVRRGHRGAAGPGSAAGGAGRGRVARCVPARRRSHRPLAVDDGVRGRAAAQQVVGWSATA